MTRAQLRPTSTRQGNETVVQPLSLFLSATDVCALLGLKKSRIYELAAAGLLPTVRLGRKVLFSRRGIQAMDQAAVDRALERQLEQAA